MAVVQGPFFVTVLLLVSPGLHCSSPPPACPELCTCQRAPLLNCSSSGLSSVPQHIQDSVTELDLSQNRLDTVTLHRPYRNLRNVWLENNTITRLSLCIDKNLGAKSVRVRKTRQLGPWSRRRCVSWAPTLQLLSVERNHLIQLPEGLEGSASLWVLQLSFNRISTIRPGELRHLQQLKELHLKYNLITHLHPQMFQDLTQLRVLDLSFNMLTSLHPSMYLSLRNIGSDVRLNGNRWQCDCSMRSLRRRMSYDSDRGLQTWSMECAFPSVLSGKDLLQLEEDDLNCFGTENSPELHQDVTVYSGSEILLSCSKQDSSWLTPIDQESVSQPQASLFISDVSEKDTGLYVCMTEDHEVVSVFNLQISRVEHARRKARSVPRASPQVILQERNQKATQSDLALAVCLSVFITFLIAFVLGVLVRPFIDVLWTKITNKRSPSATNSVSSAAQRQYENEAYSEGEEPEEIVTHRERRVTFNTVNIREDINVEYYDTLASGNQESVEAAKTEEDEHTAGESGSDNGSTEISPENNQSDARDISGTTDKRRRHKVQFEHIPDSKELEERSLSSCSDSSLSDRELKKDRMNKRDLTTPKSLQQAEDSVQQGADSSTSEIVPQLSIERTNEIPGFSSEPFADWSPHLNDTKPKDSDLWQGNEEQFDFSDSVGSNSARSSGMFGSFNDSKLNVLPTSDNQSRDDASSCSSHLSEDEPTQYTVNPDQEEEEDTKNNHNKSELTNTHLKQDARFEQQISGVDTSRTPLGFNQGNYPHDTLRPAERSEQTFSSQSSDSEQMQYRGNEKAKKEEVMEYYKPSSRIVAGERDTRKKMKPMQRSKWRGVNLGVTSFDKSLDPKAPSPPTAHSSSSSSESEAEITDRKVKHNKGRKIKKNQSAASNDISNATNPHPARWPALDHKNIPTINKRLDVKALSPTPDSSSSSDSGDNTTHVAERPGRVVNAELPFQTSGTASHDPDARWPAIDLQNIPTINRRLDIKAPSPHPDSSSSSDSDDETTHLAERPGRVVNAELPFQTSGLTSHDPDVRWPAIDLENIPSIQRRLDVKAPSPHPDSSSSSDSDDETTHLAERPGRLVNAELPFQTSGLTSPDPDVRWPAIDLENIPTINRRLDVKAPSPHPDSSSSSDSDDETTHLAERPGRLVNAKLPFQTSGLTSHDPDVRWPAIDLENIPSIQRHLDVKAPSPHPDSSSSSDSDDETTHLAERPGRVVNAELPFQTSGLTSHDQENIPTIQRRLDIKVPSLDSNSSSSSDDEEEVTHHKERPGKVDIVPIKNYEEGKVNLSTFPLQESETVSHDPLGFAVELNNITRIKRRLDIKAPSSPSKLLSDGSTNHTVDVKIKEANKISPHFSSSSSVEQDEYTEDIRNPSMTIKPHIDPRLLELGLSSAPCVKKRLDIKTHSPSTELSSSSDKSDSESTNIPVKVERGKTDVGLTNNQPGTQFPERNKRLFPVNRRLNIRGPPQPADSSFSSSDNGRLSSHTVRHETDKDGVGITTQEQKTMMHNINLGIPNVRRRLDIKAPSPQPDLVLDSTSADLRKSESNSSTSESEDENRDHKFKWSPKIPLIDISPIPKTDHNIKLEKYTVITDDLRNKPSDDNISPTPEINPELQSRWATMNLGISRFRKHLEITSHTNVPPNLPTSPLPDSPSSYTGESGTGNKSSRTRLKKNLEVKVTEEKSNPDSQLSGFDIPHVSRYLDIKVHEKAPATSPLHQQSDSLFSSESEGISTEYAVNRWKGTSQLSVVPDVAAPQNRTSLLVTHAFDESHSGTQVERNAGVELKSHTSEEGDASDSMWPQISLTNIPHVKRALDIRTLLPRESSSSSNSEDETDHSVPDLKPGVPRINRLLNIKAPSPKLKYSAKQSLHSSSATTDYDYSQIAYKRSIIKAPAQLNSFSSRSQTSDHPVAQAGLSHSVGDRSASLSPRGVSGIEQHGTLDVELTPEIRWKGIGRDLSDFSSASRRLDLGLLPPQRAPPAEPEHNPPDSSNFSHEIKQDGGKAYETLMHRYSYPTASRVSVASSRSVDQFDNTSRSNNEIFRALSEDRKEKKGLGALKAMSSKRLRWDMEDKDKDAV